MIANDNVLTSFKMTYLYSNSAEHTAVLWNSLEFVYITKVHNLSTFETKNSS